MTDDIVTRLRGLACPECGLPSTHNHFDEAADEIERLRALVDELYKRGMLQMKCTEKVGDALDEITADRDRWRNLANRLGTHLGEGLYSEGEWECREYAISAFSTWQKTDGAQLFKYEVEPQPVWWFKKGEQV